MVIRQLVVSETHVAMLTEDGRICRIRYTEETTPPQPLATPTAGREKRYRRNIVKTCTKLQQYTPSEPLGGYILFIVTIFTRLFNHTLDLCPPVTTRQPLHRAHVPMVPGARPHVLMKTDHPPTHCKSTFMQTLSLLNWLSFTTELLLCIY